jgi:hypothetical protein
VLVGSTEEVVEVGGGVEVDVVEGTALVDVTGVVLVVVLLGDGLEVDDEVVGVGDEVVGTGEELWAVVDSSGDDDALGVNCKVSKCAYLRNLTAHDEAGGRP